MARERQPMLTDKQWEKIEPLLPPTKPDPEAGARDAMTGRCSKASCGYCEPLRDGRTCPTNIPAPALAGDGCTAGKKKGCGWTSGGPSWRS